MSFWNIFKRKIPLQTATANTISPDIQSVLEKKPVPNINTYVSSKPVKVPVSFLQKLTPIGQQLGEEEIQQLNIRTAFFSAGSIIFRRGTEVDSLIYLVKGTVYMEAGNGSGQEIAADTFKALFPLSCSQFNQLTAIAKSNAIVIYVPITVLQTNRKVINPLEEQFQVSKHLKNNAFFNRFLEHFNQDELNIPSFPDVALKLRRAIQQDVAISEVVKIINMDPVIAAKLIRIVNSPIYRTLNPITNCHNAINRLGLTTTRNVVTAISMQNLVKSETFNIKKRIHNNWMQSVKISGISHTLARLTRKVDPEEALLAGLLHNIGVLPLLMFADTLPEESYGQADLDICIDELQGHIGSLILEKWEFPDKFLKIPVNTSYWFENTGTELSLTDIVLLAKFHNALTHPGNTELPIISTLPAFQKLGNQTLTPEMSLQILQ